MRHQRGTIEEGLIEAVGRGEITIRLDQWPTAREEGVIVEFLGEQKPIPCDPHHIDELFVVLILHEQERHSTHLDLRLSWVVYGDPRLIEWKVFW